MSDAGFRIGFDVGGTFTDFVLQKANGELLAGKRLTTYPDPSDACLAGLDEIIERSGSSWQDLEQAVHGTTLGSNVVIERKGRGVALITTSGFRDVLIIGREKRYQVYDLFIEKPAPLIPRSMIREVDERLMFDGSEPRPLDEAQAREVVRQLVREDMTTIAVCFLHSYVNPAHERRMAEILAEEAPGVSVTLSSDVSPEFREYERTSTTVVNAYVMTAVKDYLRRMRGALDERGCKGRLYVMQSSGGIATSEAMEQFPVRMIESGPAAGALMAATYGKLTGCPDLISFDMGGTTAKLSMISGGKPDTVGQFELHKVGLAAGSGIPMNVQSIDLVEIGAGGGSIAQVAMGVIQVGPESASSDPGPVCCRRGGTRPTVTDANLVLGYLNPSYFAGGSMELDVEAARAAIGSEIAEPLGMSVEEAAWGIHTIVNTNMELATRVVSIERGHDPRELSFIAFGGSGPVHGCRLAQALKIPRAIMPAAAGVTSAIGLLAAEVKFDVARTYQRRLTELDFEYLNAIYAEMEASATAVIRESSVAGDVAVPRTADMRYVGQGYELTVPVPSGALSAASVSPLRDAFNAAYALRYGYSSPNEPIEATTWKLTASGSGPTVTLPRCSGAAAASQKGRRKAYFPEAGGYVETPIYDREALGHDVVLEGPCIVEERESTTVLPPGTRAVVDEYANLIVELAHA
ncbi:MAG TPA: hydantoinase/oxoprolinase family protein [Chloroflexota bacterium]